MLSQFLYREAETQPVETVKPLNEQVLSEEVRCSPEERAAEMLLGAPPQASRRGLRSRDGPGRALEQSIQRIVTL
ncbi:unnamed protein product [Arctogadus glacialis]